jgi:hypothetical protein
VAVISELYIKEIIIEYYLTAVITEPRISIKVKLIIFIDTSYISIKSKKNIEIKGA